MKIGIITFHCAINYGAVLQAYGLQEYLKSIGHDVYVINYRPDYLLYPYRLFFPERLKCSGLKGSLYVFLRELLSIPIRFKRRIKFRRFCRQRLSIINLDLQSEDNDFDLFILGSDQIWNREITEDDSVFWGDARAFQCKKLITYAASAGSVRVLSEINKSDIRDRLSDFYSISVREKSLSTYLLENIGIESQVVLDPVLLAGRNAFEQISCKINVNKPYLLFFALEGNDDAVAFAEYQASAMGLELIIMFSMKEALKDRRVKQTLSPDEFISYFQQASFVITTSFHGTAFSILFEKEFVFYSSGVAQSERMCNLLSELGLSERIYSTGEKFRIFDKIDYTSVEQKLEKNRMASIDYLASNLS